MHESLESYYRLNHKLVTEYEFSLTDLDEMMPFEREVHIALILEAIEKRKNQDGAT